MGQQIFLITEFVDNNLIWKRLTWKISQHNLRHPDSFYWKDLLQPTLEKFTAAFDFFKELITLQQNKIIWNKKILLSFAIYLLKPYTYIVWL